MNNDGSFSTSVVIKTPMQPKSCQHIEDCNQDGMTCIRTEIDEYRFTETCKNADNTIDRTFDRDSSSPTETCDTEGLRMGDGFVKTRTCGPKDGSDISWYQWVVLMCIIVLLFGGAVILNLHFKFGQRFKNFRKTL